MQKTYEIAGELQTKEDCEQLREYVITLRDKALDSGYAEWSVILSHVVAFMAVAIKEMYKEEE